MSTLQVKRRQGACLSDFAFDRLMTNDLAGDGAPEEVRAHLAACARCRNRLAELEAIKAPPIEELFAQYGHKSDAPLESKARRSATQWIVPAVVMAAAAAWVMSPRLEGNHEPPAATRTKGGLSLDIVLRRPSGEVTRPAQDDKVFPGDALRFEVTAASPGFVTVLGLDAAGAVTVYAPAAESTILLESGARTVLPGSIVADRTLGPERIVAVLCAEPQPLGELRQAALRALSQAGADPQRVGNLGTSCSEASFMIEKSERQ